MTSKDHPSATITPPKPTPGQSGRFGSEQVVAFSRNRWPLSSECAACPPGVIHGYVNDSLEPVYFQVMLGRAQPETMGYGDDDLYARRADHLKSASG